MTKDEQSNELNEITEMLIRLRPARADLDSRVVFYEAGYSACLSKQNPGGQRKTIALMAASVVAMVVTASASFHMGRSYAQWSVAAAAPAAIEPADGNDNVNAIEPSSRSTPVDLDPASPDRLPAESDRRQHAAVDANAPHQDSLAIAPWVDPLKDYARSAQLDREANATLTAFHSSVVHRNPAGHDWGSFPIPDSLDRYRDSFTPSPDAIVLPTSPLAVGDLHNITHNLKAVR